VHDISDGGLLVALAEMALAGDKGIELEAAPEGTPPHAVFFGEDQARYVVAASPSDGASIVQAATAAGIPARIVGRVTGAALKLPGEAPLTLETLKKAHERWLPEFMGDG
jgi:phosphoribosylformylglycinamidine synthase